MREHHFITRNGQLNMIYIREFLDYWGHRIRPTNYTADPPYCRWTNCHIGFNLTGPNIIPDMDLVEGVANELVTTWDEERKRTKYVPGKPALFKRSSRRLPPLNRVYYPRILCPENEEIINNLRPFSCKLPNGHIVLTPGKPGYFVEISSCVRTVTTLEQTPSSSSSQIEPPSLKQTVKVTVDGEPYIQADFEQHTLVRFKGKGEMPEYRAIGYKGASCGTDKKEVAILKLGFDSDTTITKSLGSGGKVRANRATVLAIGRFYKLSNGYWILIFDQKEAYSFHDPSFCYKLGETVEIDNFEYNGSQECAPGIHFYFSPHEACNHQCNGKEAINIFQLENLDMTYPAGTYCQDDTCAFETVVPRNPENVANLLQIKDSKRVEHGYLDEVPDLDETMIPVNPPNTDVEIVIKGMTKLERSVGKGQPDRTVEALDLDLSPGKRKRDGQDDDV